MRKNFIGALLMIAALAAKEPNWLAQQTIHEVKSIEESFYAAYGPLEYKGGKYGLDFAREAAVLRSLVLNTPPKTLREAQSRLVQLLSKTRDYHVSIRFISTESATLPFSVKSIGNQLFVVSVEDSSIGLRAGDEILSIDGKSAIKVIDQLAREVGRNASLLTDRALADEAFCKRSGALGLSVPKGAIAIKFRRPHEKKERSLLLKWDYALELIAPPFKGKGLFTPKIVKEVEKSPLLGQKRVSTFYEAMREIKKGDSPYSIGARRSILSRADAIWKNEEDAFFQAAIFQGASEKKIGLLRIPTFSYEPNGENNEKFSQLIEWMQSHTDALIVDQRGNPGGYVTNLYKILGHFAHYPLQLFPERLKITSNKAIEALESIVLLSAYVTKNEQEEKLKQDILTQHYFELDQWNEGKSFSDLHYLYGITHIDRKEGVPVYTKPVVVLISENCFSCGDLFPAILKANKRATLIGQMTAGAGGSVENYATPNLMGIAGVSYTVSLIFDLNGHVIENVGARPDVFYSITLQDIVSGGSSLKKTAIDQALKSIQNGY